MSKSKIWFILTEGQTSGPFEPLEAEEKLHNLPTAQVWGKGYGEWMTPEKWRQVLRDSGYNTQKTNPAQQQSIWRLREGGKELLPLPFTELVSFLKKQSQLEHFEVLPDTGGSWKEIYTVPPLVEELGISRRAHSRVPFIGNLQYEIEEQTYTSRVISISEGGMGISDPQEIHIGTQFQGVLTSPSLFIEIPATFEVVYVTKGYAGLQFVKLADEFKSSIIEYVNKFATPT